MTDLIIIFFLVDFDVVFDLLNNRIKGRYAEGTKLNTHTTKVNLERDWLFLFGKSD